MGRKPPIRREDKGRLSVVRGLQDLSPKRLVSKGQYIRIMGKKRMLSVTAILMLLIGVASLITAILLPFLWGAEVETLLVSSLLGGVTLVFLVQGISLFKSSRAIEPVECLSEQNTFHLPPEESLVRASNVPAIEPSSELLRTVPTQPGSPKEELLRTTVAEESNAPR